MIKYLILLLAIPLGYLCFQTTSKEKNIYKKPQYFPLFQKILLILIAVFLTQNEQITLTLTFTLILIYTWNKA